MEKLILFVLLAMVSVGLCAQPVRVERSVSTVLDKYENKWRHWGGDVETVRIAAVKTVTAKDSSVSVQVSVTNRDWEKVGSSGYVGAGGWAVGSTESLGKRSGFVVVDGVVWAKVVAFLNDMFLLSRAKNPDKEVSHTLQVGDRIGVSFRFDGGKWVQAWSVDGAVFEVPDVELIPFLKKMKEVGDRVK